MATEEKTPNGSDLTVGLLRAEIRAARAEDRNDFLAALATQFKPVTDHINAINAGEFPDGMKRGIVAVVEEEKSGLWLLRSNRASVVVVMVAIIGILVNVGLNIAYG